VYSFGDSTYFFRNVNSGLRNATRHAGGIHVGYDPRHIGTAVLYMQHCSVYRRRRNIT